MEAVGSSEQAKERQLGHRNEPMRCLTYFPRTDFVPERSNLGREAPGLGVGSRVDCRLHVTDGLTTTNDQ